MLCAYYKPRKCEHVRFCHLELILLIILFLCGMLLKQVPYLLKMLLLLLIWILFVMEVLGMVFPKYVLIYLFGKPYCFKLLLCIALRDCVNYLKLSRISICKHGF